MFFELFGVIELKFIKTSGIKGQGNLKMDRMLSPFDDVFKGELTAGLPPKGNLNHEIEVEKNSKPRHRPLFQLSFTNLKGAKKYVEDLLTKKKITSNKSPCVSSLFFYTRERETKSSG